MQSGTVSCVWSSCSWVLLEGKFREQTVLSGHPYVWQRVVLTWADGPQALSLSRGDSKPRKGPMSPEMGHSCLWGHRLSSCWTWVAQ